VFNAIAADDMENDASGTDYLVSREEYATEEMVVSAETAEDKRTN